MKYWLFLLFAFIHTIFTLPITQEEEEVSAYYVSVDRLSQIIATHLQFDHFDFVASNTHSAISKAFQHHIQINIQGDDDNVLMSHNTNQYAIQQHLPTTLDMMDLEILKSQIFAAIQAHLEGNLPLVWDKLAEKLNKHHLESFIRQLLVSTCQSTEIVASECLKENASLLATQLDTYVQEQLNHVFNALNTDILPDLLQHTAADLKGILNYFNAAFLQDGNRQFTLKVIPWNHDIFKSKLLDFAVDPTLSNDISETSHSVAFFIKYASMAKLS